MTPELTLSRTLGSEDTHVTKNLRFTPMLYTMNEGQLFRVWTVIRFLGEIRETQDRLTQSEILTDAQILLTAFVLDLEPLPEDQTNSAKFETGLAQTVKLDA